MKDIIGTNNGQEFYVGQDVPTTTATPTITSTSDSYRSDISKTQKDIQDSFTKNLSVIGDTQGIKDVAASNTSEIDTYRKNLETQNNTISDINTKSDQNKQTLLTKQEGETGSQSTTLARIGGYLGEGTASMGMMKKLETTHTQEVNTLESARLAAVNAAQMAYNEKDFAAAKEKINIAKDLEDEIYKRKTEFSKTSLDYLTTTRQMQSDELSKAKDEQAQQSKAREEAIKYGVSKPFYTIDGQTLISTTTGQALHNMDEYKQLGGKGDGSDIQMVDKIPVKFETKNTVGDDGRVHSYHIGYNAQGQVVSKEDLGATKASSSGPGNKPVDNKGKVPAKVTNLINSSSNWGDAAQKLKDANINPTNYDDVLTSHFTITDNIGKLKPAWDALALSERNLENWNAGLQAFLELHPYDKSEAAKQYSTVIKKPKK